ncbi:hypothetical protein [Mycoplasma suis]|uniref:hypothetical protein n=1 Tax=Mycoplasma suis TaxID=57372 RepID=UPI00030B76B6|nr:hypothetical protein [Mycoplasma suis]
MFKGLSSHILSSVFGLSVVTAGGYGAVTLLRKEVKEDNSFLKWYEGDSEKVSEITFAEYIVKGQSNGEGQVCGRWEKGKQNS